MKLGTLRPKSMKRMMISSTHPPKYPDMVPMHIPAREAIRRMIVTATSVVARAPAMIRLSVSRPR